MQDRISKTASNSNLIEVFKSKGIGHFLNRNPGEAGEIGNKTMIETMGAIIGAAYLDGGLDAAKTVAKAFDLL
jgi:dsRNA-specific ribonuclease